MKKITFIGLGVMGSPMAGHLSQRGYEVTVYNRSVEKSKLWTEQYNGTYATSIIEAVKNAAGTGKIGDGKIFITELTDVVRIRTGETGSKAI